MKETQELNQYKNEVKNFHALAVSEKKITSLKSFNHENLKVKLSEQSLKNYFPTPGKKIYEDFNTNSIFYTDPQFYKKDLQKQTFELPLKNKVNLKDINWINNINLTYNKNNINVNKFNNFNGLVFEGKTQINAETIAEYAYPLAQFIEQTQPDYIMACDRGARLIAVATKMMYNELYGPLPTKDRRISFRKMSRNVPEKKIRKMLKKDVARMLAETESPTLLILDDWVASGSTQKMLKDIISELSEDKIEVVFGVMRGRGADVSGNPDSMANCDWHDRPELIGVDYDSRIRPRSVGSKDAISYRNRMKTNIRNFVHNKIIQN